MRELVLAASVLVAPHLVAAQQAKPDSCKSVGLKAPTLWIGAPETSVDIRTGPGTGFPLHESGALDPGEQIQILQECHGWLQARVVPLRMIDWAIQQNGRVRAKEMLLFWVKKELIRRRR